MLPTSIDEVPPAPREPGPRARAIIFGDATRAQLIAGFFFFVMGCGFTYVFCRGLPADLALTFDGTRATGTLLSQQRDRTMQVNGVRPLLLHFSYAFAGQTREATSSTLGAPPALDSGSSAVPIEVFAPIPSVARIAGTHVNEGGLLVIGPDMSMLRSSQRPWLVCWEFSVEDKLYRGKVGSMQRGRLEELLARETLVVLYDPRDPRANTVYVDG